MALGDRLRLAKAGTAQAQLAGIKATEQLADRLARLGVQKKRETKEFAIEERRVKGEEERAEFQRFRGEFFEAQTAGTTTPEQLTRAAEFGLIRATVPREPKPLTATQTLNEQVATLEQKVLAGTATSIEKQQLESFRATRRAPIKEPEERPSDIQKTIGRQRFKAFEAEAQLASGAETPEEIANIQRLPLRVGSFIAQLGFDNFDVGFGELSQALEQIIPGAESDTERIELLLMGKDIVESITKSGASLQSQRAALRIQEQTLASEIGAEAAATLIDFILKAQR